ncbi:hypothetical protein HDV06_001758 [Boothiomyces sp. JEL0866]|nr:hypothetical protein HDV06_001758 [Boothiomyces sp. JEL0866]
MHTINFIQLTFYALYGYVLHPRIYFKIAALFSSALSICIILLNLEILAIFKCLNEKITDEIIRKCKVGFVIFSIIALSPNLVTLWYEVEPPVLKTYDEIGSLVHAVLGMIYDNCQAIYLTRLVYSFKKSKKQATANNYKAIVLLNLITIFIDWGGASLYAYTLYFETSAHSKFLIVDTVISFHGSFMVIVFLLLKKLALTGVKKKELVAAEKSTNNIETVKITRQIE